MNKFFLAGMSALTLIKYRNTYRNNAQTLLIWMPYKYHMFYALDQDEVINMTEILQRPHICNIY